MQDNNYLVHLPVAVVVVMVVVVDMLDQLMLLQGMVAVELVHREHYVAVEHPMDLQHKEHYHIIHCQSSLFVIIIIIIMNTYPAGGGGRYG